MRGSSTDIIGGRFKDPLLGQLWAYDPRHSTSTFVVLSALTRTGIGVVEETMAGKEGDEDYGVSMAMGGGMAREGSGSTNGGSSKSPDETKSTTAEMPRVSIRVCIESCMVE